MQVYCSVPLILSDKMITGCQNLGRSEASRCTTSPGKTQPPGSSGTVTCPAPLHPDPQPPSSMPRVKVTVIKTELALCTPSRKTFQCFADDYPAFCSPGSGVEPSPVALQASHPIYRGVCDCPNHEHVSAGRSVTVPMRWPPPGQSFC